MQNSDSNSRIPSIQQFLNFFDMSHVICLQIDSNSSLLFFGGKKIQNLFTFLTFKIEIANAFWRCSSLPHLRSAVIPFRHLIMPRPILRAMHKLSSSFTIGNIPLLSFSSFDSHFPSFEHAPKKRRLFRIFFVMSFLSTKIRFFHLILPLNPLPIYVAKPQIFSISVPISIFLACHRTVWPMRAIRQSML
jgi:hypothetical protein